MDNGKRNHVLASARIAAILTAAGTLVLGYIGLKQHLAAPPSGPSAPGFWSVISDDLRLFILSPGAHYPPGPYPLALNVARLVAPLVTVYVMFEVVRAAFVALRRREPSLVADAAPGTDEAPRPRRTRTHAGPPPVSDLPTRRAHDANDAESEELENFERRLAWWRLYQCDRGGWTNATMYRQALSQALRLEERPPPGEREPDGPPPTDIGVLDARLATLCRVARLEIGEGAFFGDGVAIQFDENEVAEAVPVKVALRAQRADLDRATARMFRHDSDTGRWHLVAQSGTNEEGSYAWLYAYRAGTYALAGLPRDWAAGAALLTILAFRDQLTAAAAAGSLDSALEVTGQAVLGALPTPALGEKGTSGFGEPGGSRLDGIDAVAFMKHLGNLGRELSGTTQVALDLLDDICRPLVPPGQLTKPFTPRLPVGWRLPGRLPIPWPGPSLWFDQWRSSGPRNKSGRIKSLAIHPTDGRILWAGAANGGVWKTTNAGLTWYRTMLYELSLAIGAVAVARSNPSVLYAATGEDTTMYTPWWPGVGVYRSDDGGASWTLRTPVASTRCTKVLIHPTDHETVYVAGDAGLHRSTDGGVTWFNVRADHVCDALLDPTDPRRIYAAVWNDGVYLSTNFGASWDLASTGLPTGSAAEWIKLTMGRDGTYGTNLILAKMGADSRSIYRSTDGARSWSQVAPDVDGVSYNEWTNVISVDPTDPDRILAGSAYLARSTDGSTFNGTSGTHTDHHQIVYDPSDHRVVYAATDGGVYRSENGGATWNIRSDRLVATQFYSIGVSQGPTLRLGGATQDQGIIQTTSTNNADEWVDTFAGNEGGVFVVDPNDDETIYAGPWDMGLRRSTDGGNTWTAITAGLDGNGVADLAVCPNDSNRLLAGAGEIYESIDRGSHWVRVAPVSLTNGQVIRVVFSPSDPETCYATTSTGKIFRSSLNGSSGSWAEPYSAANQPRTGVIAAIAVSPVNHDRIYIGYAGYGGGHVWRSSRGGADWTNASGTGYDALPDTPVNALVVDNMHPDVVYVATSIGVFRTTNAGATWEPFGAGMPRAVVSGLVLRRADRSLHASTMGCGAYHRYLH